MIQLWVNLPAKEKLSSPRYQGLANTEIPQVSFPNGAGTVRVIAGDFRGTRGAAATFTPINAWDMQLTESASAEFDLPEGHTALLIVQSGEVRLQGAAVKAVELAELDRAGTIVQLRATTPARLLLLSGEPVVGQGPFVMNTSDEIQQAIRDFPSGRMGRPT